MPVSMTITDRASVAGRTFPSVEVITTDGAVIKEPTVAAAKVGQLTTRTSNTQGTLTMASGHGFTDADRLDVYWAGGSRRGMVVGTVSVNSVPLTDSGSGDNLPTNLTAITAMVPREEEFVVTGDDVSALAFYSNKRGTIVLAESDDGEVAFKVIGGATGTQQSYIWSASRDPVNPVASGDITKVFFSHSDSSASADMRVIAMNE
jgi:hypothetical protein